MEEEEKTRELIRAIQAERKNQGLTLKDSVCVYNNWLPTNNKLIKRIQTKTCAAEIKRGDFRITSLK